MSKNILIVGAGIGGLTAALALLRKGFDVTVCERASALKEIGAGLHLGPNGTSALYGLGLREPLLDLGVRSVKREMRLWSTGEAWELPAHGADSEARYNAPYLLMHRADLHGMLLDAVRALKPDAVITGAACVDLEWDEDGAEVTLVGGGKRAADIVVGADGVHSVVREKLGKVVTPEFTGNMFWRGMAPIESVPERERRSAGGWFSHNATVTVYPVRRGELLNFVGTVRRATWNTLSWTEQGTTEECLADFEGWHPNVLEIIRNMGTPYKWGLFQFETLKAWTSGCVTLLGDACHAMPPSLGQGAIMAIEDGVVLARCLEMDPQDPLKALKRYENARVARSTRVVNSSWQESRGRNNEALQDEKRGSAYLSERFSENRVNDFYDWIFSYNAHQAEL